MPEKLSLQRSPESRVDGGAAGEVAWWVVSEDYYVSRDGGNIRAGLYMDSRTGAKMTCVVPAQVSLACIDMIGHSNRSSLATAPRSSTTVCL